MGRVIPVASGKGGVGKSVVAANLGLCLARSGKTVILVDLDLGASNLHTFLGVRNRNAGIGSLLWKKERNLSALLTETGEERLWLVPGDSLLPGVANLDWHIKRRIIKELADLPADFVILDLGAGSSWNVVDFWLAGNGGFVVIVPEITSVLNAYSFLKSAAYRCLSLSLPAGGPERKALFDYAGQKTEGSGTSFLEFARRLAPGSGGGEVPRVLASLQASVVLNRANEAGDAALGYRLRDLAAKNLGLRVGFGAFLPEDPSVGGSVAARKPLSALDPCSPFSCSIAAFARRLSLAPPPAGDPEPGPLVDEDLDSLARESLASEASDS